MPQTVPVKDHTGHGLATMPAVAVVLWRLCSSDLLTFVLPNTLFGICTALCTSMWTEDPGQSIQLSVPWSVTATRFSKALIWNWFNLLLFNLSNQRLPDSIAEDKLNKPYRPIPSGLLSPATAQRALLYGIFAVASISYLWLGAYQESIIMVALNWTYNDLRGGDENFVLRNFIIALAFGTHNHASSRIARGYSYFSINDKNSFKSALVQAPQLSSTGHQWIVLISMIIFTTMQIQDFQDVEGDKERGRQSLILVVGMRASRWFTASQVLIWCGTVPYTLNLTAFSLPLLAMVALGVYVAWRILYLTSKTDDSQSWKLWALWLIAIYTLPLVAKQ